MFRKIKDKLTTILGNTLSACITFSILILFWVGWPLGIYHSFQHHSTANKIASFFPLWGIYRGVESFFHKNSSLLVNLKNLSVVLFNNTNSTSNENYSKALSYIMQNKDKLNEKEYISLKEFCRNYIIAKNSMINDVEIFIEQHLTSQPSEFNYSEKTNILIEKLEGQGVDEIIEETKKQIETDLSKATKTNINSNMNKEELHRINLMVKEYAIILNEQSKSSYKHIFNEEIK